MAQDVQRWRNQNIVCSVFNAAHHGGGYLVEAINVDRNLQRAYLRVPTLVGIRGELLRHYVDSMLKILSKEDASRDFAEALQDQ